MKFSNFFQNWHPSHKHPVLYVGTRIRKRKNKVADISTHTWVLLCGLCHAYSYCTSYSASAQIWPILSCHTSYRPLLFNKGKIKILFHSRFHSMLLPVFTEGLVQYIVSVFSVIYSSIPTSSSHFPPPDLSDQSLLILHNTFSPSSLAY